MAASEKEFQLTPDEAGRLRDALKDKEFRKLLAEYADEISNPENKKRYEQEITELERMRGVDAKFINPTPGFVLKTASLPDNVKAFVNVCQSEAVEKATATRGTGERGQRGEQWSIPFSLSPSREDVDKAKKKCRVFDAVFHPATFQKGQENPRFKQLLVDTALDGIERELHVKLDRSNVKHLRMPYKGMSVPTVIRKKMKEENPKSSPGSDLPFTVPYPPLKEDDKKKKKEEKEEKSPNKPGMKQPKPPDEPRYHVLHRDDLSMQDFTNSRESTLVRRPRELVVTVELPNVDSAVGVELDIFEKRIFLETSEPHYKLDLALPYPVEEEKAGAKFDKPKKTLTITLPVVPLQTTPTPVRPLVTEVALETTNHVQKPESHDSISEAKSANQNTETVPLQLTNQDAQLGSPDLDTKLTNQNTEVVSHHLTNQDAQVQSPDLDTKPTNQKAGLTTGTPQQWTSTGSYKCPLFSYKQDEEHVCFVLHTPAVKEKSLVSHFDQHQVQLTFSTATSAGGQFYSLYLKFPEKCVLCVEGCKVEVGVENVVVVGRKAEESQVTWERFEVGSTSTQTTEKLFLTVANVQSAMAQLDSLPDPWAHGEGSEGTMCKVSTVSDKVLEITISNSETPSKTPSGEADSREEERESEEGGREGGGGGGGEGGERERGEGGGRKEGGEEGGEAKERGERRGGGGRCEEVLPEEAQVVKEQTKRNTTDSDEQGLNHSTGGGGGEREVTEEEVTREGGGGGTGHEGDAGTGHEGDTGTGHGGDTGTGHEGDAGTGHEGDAGTGQEGDAGTGHEGDAGTGHEGDAGTGQEGDTGTGHKGNAGTGHEGDAGTGHEGDAGTGHEGNAGTKMKSTVQLSNKLIFALD